MGMEPRADQIMRRTLREQRESPRQRVCISGVISCSQPQCRDVIALVRDVSSDGAFFYANFPVHQGAPEIGAAVELCYTSADHEKHLEMICRGQVVRIVKYPAGAATGVAMRLVEQQAVPRLLEKIS